jgi:UDP-N-acetylglucosamine--N-acetylmuramyl-(pentapeptide) pyrophosphoryl-undecaprenol N-acetylglucosamine transferase
MEQKLVERAGLAYKGINTGQLRGLNPLAALVNIGKMARGVWQSLQILRTFRPDVCFVTGGYVCVPVVIACRLRGIPVLIYLPDMVPGWAIRSLSRLAQRVAVTFPAAAVYFGGEVPQGKGVVTGYPVREELITLTGNVDRTSEAHHQQRWAARQELAERLGWSALATGTQQTALPLLLVWGASQGSRNINQALWTILPAVLEKALVLHITGERDWPLFQQENRAESVPAELRERYHPVAYLHDEMALTLVAADLTVARAGASSMGEFPVARLPAILVPLLGVNQLQNAEVLAEHGGACIVADAQLRETLAATLLPLLDDQSQREAMEQALARLAQPNAAHKIAAELVKLARRA